MTIYNNLINQEFRDFAASDTYPFMATSIMRAADGRAIPSHAILDAIVYPPDGVHGRVSIYGMRATVDGQLDIGFMRGEETWASCLVASTATTGYVKALNGLYCGSVVFRADGLRYLLGMAKYSTLFFNPDGLVLRPDRVLPIRRKRVSVTVNGIPATNQAVPFTLSFASDRFTVDGDTVTFDGSVKEPLIRAGTPITSVNGKAIRADGSLTIRTPPTSNLQILTQNGEIIIHKRGD